MFKGILESPEEIPFAIKKDPQKLIDWARNPKGREKAREVMEKAGDGGAGLFGATKEDLQQLGVESSAGTVSLEEAAKKKGGKLKKMMGGGTMGRTMMKPNMMYKKGGKGKK